MIDGIGRNALARLAVSTSVQGAARTLTGAEPITSATGRASVTPRLGGIIRDMAASPPVDGDRVAALRNAIASGNYAVDADAIAARMLAFYGSGRR